MRTKFKQIEDELNATYLERQQVVRGLLVGLLAKHHVLLLGPPGTAKSAIAEDLCSRIGGQYFRWLLSRTSTPEELFGPISLKALEQDKYTRVTKGKLPEATIAFIDEIFKCNSAVLNSMLSVLNERLFFNNGQPVPVPLQMAIGASNELPEDREELGALWDRFLLRYVVNYVKTPQSFEKLLFGVGAASVTTITEQELSQAQVEVTQIDTKNIAPLIAQLRQEIIKLNIPVSDRRWKQSLDLIRANAWLNGHAKAHDEDLEILADSLWVEIEQIQQVKKAIMSLVNPLDQEVLDLLDQAIELYHTAMNAEDYKETAVGTEVNVKLKKITNKLHKLQEQTKEAGKHSVRVDDAIEKVVAWNREVISKCLGITI